MNIGAARIQKQRELQKIINVAKDLINRTSFQAPDWRSLSNIYQLGRIKVGNCGATMGQGQGQCTTVS